MINYATLTELLELEDDRNPSLLIELANMFYVNCPKQFQKIREASETKNFKEIFQIAHTLKSSCNYLGAEKMAQICQSLEGWSHNPQRNSSEGQQLLKELEENFEVGKSEIQRFITNLKPPKSVSEEHSARP